MNRREAKREACRIAAVLLREQAFAVPGGLGLDSSFPDECRYPPADVDRVRHAIADLVRELERRGRPESAGEEV